MNGDRFRTISALALVLIVGAGPACRRPSAVAPRSITVKGSDTMVILGQTWAEAYMKKHPDVSISVQGGGSGTGIAAFITRRCDICQSSRKMSGKEVQQCKDRNIVSRATVLAMDGISIAVHRSNPVDSLTLNQLQDVYTGKLRNWKQAGGKDAPIVVLSRESSSGTYIYFQELVLKNQTYARTALLMPSTKAIQQEISNNPNAVGYGGVAYFKGKKNVKIIPISKGKGSPAVEPTDGNVISGRYPIARPLFLYTAGKPKGVIGDYIRFCLSPEGQKIVSQVGYVPIGKLR